MPAAIEVSHLTKEYRLGALKSVKQTLLKTGARLLGRQVEEPPLFKALDDVSFSIQPGEVVGIIGHNGAGKSTLLKMLAGISTPTRGSVKVNGRIAPLIEVGAGFVPDFTGRENVYLNGSILGMSKKEIDRKFDEIVDFAEMTEFIDTPVKRYSSGMQVKLAFAVATSVEAEILIVDEVLAVGDLAFQRKCFDRMEELIKRQGRTVLLVSHNIRQVERISGRVILLDHGRVAANGDPKTVCGTFYDQNDKRIVDQVGRARMESTGQVELVGIRMFDESGRPAQHACTGDKIAFELTFDVHEPIDHPMFGFGVHTTDLLYLSTEITEDRYRGVRIEPGRMIVSATINSVPLLPGAYSLRIGVNGGEVTRNIFYAENVAPLLIRSRSQGRSQAAAEGFFPLNVSWQLNKTPDHSCEPALPVN
ncbi:MAG: ABC transporter ATP-binding protein [Burkholderiales bacterium]|nr:ABC transporter ATP-binding protein [Burkholderiales bacterium]